MHSHRVFSCAFLALGLSLSRHAGAADVNPGHTASPAVHGEPGSQGAPQAGELPVARLALRLAAPVSHATIINGPSQLRQSTLTLLGGAIGLIVLDRGWFEASYRLLASGDSFGNERALRAGYLWRGRFEPHRWQLSFPTYLALSSMERPPTYPTDAHTIHEPLVALGVGGRAVVTRNFGKHALELSASLELLAPIHRSPVEGDRAYYADPETRWLTDVGITLGWQFGL